MWFNKKIDVLNVSFDELKIKSLHSNKLLCQTRQVSLVHRQIKLAPLPPHLLELYQESLISTASAIYPSNSYLHLHGHHPKINRGVMPQQEQNQPLTAAY
jgi:hypothetical protein